MIQQFPIVLERRCKQYSMMHEYRQVSCKNHRHFAYMKICE